ncbi:hypothetical protein LEP1GSC175_1709 [Leptospira santarosai str. HAI821]|nr:hypothetical protein LEP1GSC068_2019 [Leptospira sp. Fiocruz LV3954]EMO29499.1 hypothetical protein LEP1GSC170_1517 [Leptospira interrogans serovar Bataviae str. HAI135]EMO32789.1 hypothetical protein LEP1GSC175_1709 [Leptospira santarosai str. HAI821]
MKRKYSIIYKISFFSSFNILSAEFFAISASTASSIFVDL